MTPYQQESPYNYPEFVKARFKLMATPVESLLHAAVGVAGEWLELMSATALDHRIEECGDCEFYIQGGYQVLGGEPMRQHTGILIVTPVQWNEEAGAPLDLVKKTWIYNAVLEGRKLSAAFQRVQLNLEEYYRKFLGVSREAVLDWNVQKLRKRYPDGYTDKAAAERADKCEGRMVINPREAS